MVNAKGQLAVETMIIYGLVILVALSVVGFLIYFNILDLGSYLPDQCNLGGIGDLKCEEMKLTDTDFELGIRNSGQRPISALKVTVTDDLAVHFSTEVSGDAVDLAGDAISDTNSLAPGDVVKVVLEDSSGNPIGGEAGKVLRGSIKTEYEYKDGAITQEASGTIRIKAVK